MGIIRPALQRLPVRLYEKWLPREDLYVGRGEILTLADCAPF